MTDLAPILLFVYNRPDHTARTISALKSSNLSSESELFVYCDGPKINVKGDTEKVEAVRSIINNISGFKSVNIFESEKNKGLGNSIIEASHHAFTFYDKIITIEDDVLVGKHFLEYMNTNLTSYKNNKKVQMISGCSFDLPFQKYKKSNFFLSTGTSQAWGTWKQKWARIEFDPQDYIILKKNKWLRFKFNLFGSVDYSTMLINQMEKTNVSSWAIRLRWHMFKEKSLTLFPAQNLIENIGWDGSGANCTVSNTYEVNSKLMNSECKIAPKKIDAKPINMFILIYYSYKIRIVGYVKYRLSKKKHG